MTDTTRFDALQSQVNDLQVANARLSVTIEHLANSVSKLDNTVSDLLATVNKSKGALWVIVGASTALGAGINAVMAKLLQS